VFETRSSPHYDFIVWAAFSIDDEEYGLMETPRKNIEAPDKVEQ
jgi:hypothetical protein